MVVEESSTHGWSRVRGEGENGKGYESIVQRQLGAQSQLVSYLETLFEEYEHHLLATRSKSCELAFENCYAQPSQFWVSKDAIVQMLKAFSPACTYSHITERKCG